MQLSQNCDVKLILLKKKNFMNFIDTQMYSLKIKKKEKKRIICLKVENWEEGVSKTDSLQRKYCYWIMISE